MGVIRVCGTAELGENLPRNTDFLQFFDGTTEFFIPAGCEFCLKITGTADSAENCAERRISTPPDDPHHKAMKVHIENIDSHLGSF